VKQYFLIGLAFILFPLVGMAQAAPRFEASVSNPNLNVNSSFEVVFTLFDGQGSGFRPPDFSDFQVEAGPSTRINASIINGKPSQEMGFAYILRPRRAGRFSIGRATIRVGNQDVQTQPIPIEVADVRTPKRGEAFVEARPSTNKIWVGQQLILDYVIYLSDPSWSVNIASESDYAGFVAVPWGSPAQGSERIEGTNYATIAERISLFPQKSGAFSISPVTMDVLEWQRDPFSPFGHSTKRMSIASTPLAVEVLPLPAGAPPSFTGAVGRFLMEAEMNRSSGTTDESFTLRMTLAGNGDMKRVEAPALPLPAGLRGYDPKVTAETAPKSYQTLTAQKTIEYLITAQQPGRHEIRPEFSYFDTDSAKYVTLFAGPFVIEVAQGRGVAAEGSGTDAELSPPAKQKGNAGIGPLGRLALGFAVVAGLVLVLLLVRRKQSAAKPKEEAPRLDARQRLSLAARYLHLGEIQAFYREAAAAMYDFCGERLHIPPSEWTKERIGAGLRRHDVQEDLIARTLDVLQSAELALYARGAKDGTAASADYRAAVEVLDALEQQLPK
jgi:hypothetical protein